MQQVVLLTLVGGHDRVRAVVSLEQARHEKMLLDWLPSEPWWLETSVCKAIHFDIVSVDILYVGNPSAEVLYSLSIALNSRNDSPHFFV